MRRNTKTVVKWWITTFTVMISSAVLEWILPITSNIIAPFLGGLLVTIASNVYARLFPPHVADMPTIVGIVMLVPGAYGLKGALAMTIQEDPSAAVTVMFNMLLIATQLSVAVIMGNILVPGNRKVTAL